MVRSKVLLDPAVELFEVLSCFRVDVVLDFVEALVFRVGQFAFGVDRPSMGVGVVGVLRASGPNNVLGVLARVHKLWMSWSLKACVSVDLVDPAVGVGEVGTRPPGGVSDLIGAVGLQVDAIAESLLGARHESVVGADTDRRWARAAGIVPASARSSNAVATVARSPSRSSPVVATGPTAANRVSASG